MQSSGKGSVLLSYINLGDLVFFIVGIVAVIAVIGLHMNSNDRFSAYQLVKEIKFGLVYAATPQGEGEYIYPLPMKYCEIKINRDTIYAKTEKDSWKVFIDTFLSWIGRLAGANPKIAEASDSNPLGRYLKKNEYTFSCAKDRVKKLVFKFKAGELDVREEG